jgi:hypothetical protein
MVVIMKNKKNFGLMCVDCGGNATKGSMKHPYCEKCFKKKFRDDKAYVMWMEKYHV